MERAYSAVLSGNSPWSLSIREAPARRPSNAPCGSADPAPYQLQVAIAACHSGAAGPAAAAYRRALELVGTVGERCYLERRLAEVGAGTVIDRP